MKTFRNPLSYENFSDPFITYDKDTGYYYFIASCQCNELMVYRSRSVGDLLKNGESKVAYHCQGVNGEWGPMWAPEMYKINGRWYIYTSCQEVNSTSLWETKRLLILQSKTENPFDGFEFGSKPDTSIFAIDPTCMIIDNKQYVCYSEVENDSQILVIREMKNPLTFTDNYAVIARPTLSWELDKGYKINEGAFFLKRNEKLFIVYSANGCWCDDYCLGLLEFTGGNICDKGNWSKYPQPIFVKGNEIYGVGHATFFRSPDEKEMWCAYHCLLHSNPQQVEMDRHTCIQKIEFSKTDYPIIGEPIGIKIDINVPSGENE